MKTLNLHTFHILKDILVTFNKWKSSKFKSNSNINKKVKSVKIGGLKMGIHGILVKFR